MPEGSFFSKIHVFKVTLHEKIFCGMTLPKNTIVHVLQLLFLFISELFIKE